MRLLWIGVALVVVATGALVVVGGSGSDSDDRVAVGDCLDVLEGLAPADTSGELPASKVGCGNAKAAYRVALRLPGAAATCPSPIYIVRRDTAPDGPVTYCMTFNVEEGECFVQSPAEIGAYDCALGPRRGALKILRVVEGVTDEARCKDIDEPGVLSALIPEPARTYCYQEYDTGGDAPLRNA